MTTRRIGDRWVWGSIALLAAVLFVGEKVFAQVQCEGVGEFYGTLDDECGQTIPGYPFTCTYKTSDTTSKTLRFRQTSSECDDIALGAGESFQSCSYSTYTYQATYITEETNNTACKAGTYNPALGICEFTEVPGCECSDGELLEAGAELGYTTCDRPPLQECNGSFILSEDTCSTECDSYSSCLSDACSSSGCPDGEHISHFYEDLINGGYQSYCSGGGSNLCVGLDGEPEESPNECTDETSCMQAQCDAGCPDGGYMDGFIFGGQDNYTFSCSDTGNLCGNNPNQVPDIDQTNTSITNSTQISETDSNAEALSNLQTTQQENTDALLVAINELNESGDNNTVSINTGTENVVRANQQGFQNVVDAIGELGEEIEGEEGPCKPDQPDYIECLENPDETSPTDTASLFMARVESAPLLQAFGGITSVFSGSGACPVLSIDGGVYGTFGTDIHCDLALDFQTLLAVVFSALWSLLGIRIVLSA